MTITASLAGFTPWDNAAGGSRSVGTVTAGRRVGVKVWYWNDTADDAFVAGDLTQTGGDATIGTPILAVQAGGSAGGGVFVRSAVWWVPVTGNGSLTLSVAANANSYGGISTGEFATDQAWDDTPEDFNGAFNAADSQTSASSGNATSAGAAVFLGALCWNTGGTSAALALSNAPPWVSTGIESDSSAHEPGAAAYRIVSSGTTDAAAWTGTMTADAFSGSAAVVAVFREVAAAATLEQEGFRFGRDDGAENAHAWEAAQDANITAPAGQTRVLNVLVNVTGDPGTKTVTIGVRKVGEPTYAQIPVKP